MINNLHSYYYIEQKYDDGLFNKYIDMVYVLTLENSTRINSYIKELNKYKLLSNVTIQVNKGYKNCIKNIYKQTSIYDLNDAFYHCFKHANNRNYKNIMILEDDFFLIEV